MISPNATYNPAIDHIRALAAILVLMQHSHARIGGRLAFGYGGELIGAQAATPLDALAIEGHTGVALFMVLSGFIFTHIAYGSVVQYGRFVMNRILRIYPLMIAVFLVGQVVWRQDPSLADGIAVLLIPFQIKPFFWHVPELYPFTTLFWAISAEFQFYLMFPILLALLHRRGTTVLLVLLAAGLAIRMLLAVAGFDHVQTSYFTIFGRIDQFVVGMIAAVVIRRRHDEDLRLWLISASVAVLVLLFAFNRSGGLTSSSYWRLLWPTVEGVAWGVFVVGYLNVAGGMHADVSRVIAGIGEVSFSIYLLHLLIIAAVLRHGPNSCGLDYGVAALLYAALLVLPVTLVVSYVTYQLIERPFLLLRVRYLAPGGQAKLA